MNYVLLFGGIFSLIVIVLSFVLGKNRTIKERLKTTALAFLWVILVMIVSYFSYLWLAYTN